MKTNSVNFATPPREVFGVNKLLELGDGVGETRAGPVQTENWGGKIGNILNQKKNPKSTCEFNQEKYCFAVKY